MSDSGTRAEGAEGSAARQLATAFPLVVAVSVAFLYSLGAIELVGQLKEDHVDALAALPLVPLQQVLGRGIWVATHQLWWLVPVAVAGVVLGERGSRDDSSRTRVRVKGAAGILASIVLILFLPALVLMRYLATFVAFGIVAFTFRERFTRGLSLSEVVGAGALIAVLYTASGALVTPHHLPVAELRLQNSTVRGALIATDGSTWYLSRRGGIDAIPTQSVVSSQIGRVRHRHDHSLWRLVF